MLDMKHYAELFIYMRADKHKESDTQEIGLHTCDGA